MIGCVPLPASNRSPASSTSPLLDNVEGVSLAAVFDNIRTLDDPGADRARARAELLASPVFTEVIVSADARTTALLLSMRDDEAYRALLAKRNRLLIARSAEDPDDPGRAAIDGRAGRPRALLRVRETPRHREPAGRDRGHPGGARGARRCCPPRYA